MHRWQSNLIKNGEQQDRIGGCKVWCKQPHFPFQRRWHLFGGSWWVDYPWGLLCEDRILLSGMYCFQNVFVCALQKGHNKHQFIGCLVAMVIWKFIYTIYASIIGVKKFLFLSCVVENAFSTFSDILSISKVLGIMALLADEEFLCFFKR